MPAPVTAQDFLDIARRSNQVDSALLERFSDGLEGGKEFPSPLVLANTMVRDGVLTLFQAEQFLLGKYKGFELGGYRILDRLGQGGTGVVYLARHEIMNRLAAIKVLPSPLADNSRYRALFQHEARAAATLHHPNVIQIHDFRKEGSLAYLIMEYIDGPNLQQILDHHGPLSIPQACEYVRQAALGLHHAHEGGLIHRDVKPANLLVNPDGQVKVLDLGLALFRSGTGLSGFKPENPQMILGTADYLAPEQALNQNQVDARTDVYSLGATLHAMLCGRPPFHQGTIAQKLMWHQTVDPPAVHDIRQDVPAVLSALVRSMLEKSPQKRPTSAQEVALVLAGWAMNEPRPNVPYPGRFAMAMMKHHPPTAPLPRPSSPNPYSPRPESETRSHSEEDTAILTRDDLSDGGSRLAQDSARDRNPKHRGLLARIWGRLVTPFFRIHPNPRRLPPS